jgi:translation initiation factor IF-1
MEVQVVSQVMLFSVYCKNNKKYMDKLCGKNAVCVGM